MHIKKRTILLIGVFLIMGIIIGTQNSVGNNNYFEEAKNEFEQNITKPNNNYEVKNTQVEGNTISKIAVKLDEKINDLLTILLEKIK